MGSFEDPERTAALAPLDPVLFEPDWSIVQTTVYPLLGRAYIADGKHEPTLRQRLFGRRRPRA